MNRCTVCRKFCTTQELEGHRIRHSQAPQRRKAKTRARLLNKYGVVAVNRTEMVIPSPESKSQPSVLARIGSFFRNLYNRIVGK